MIGSLRRLLDACLGRPFLLDFDDPKVQSRLGIARPEAPVDVDGQGALALYIFAAYQAKAACLDLALDSAALRIAVYAFHPVPLTPGSLPRTYVRAEPLDTHGRWYELMPMPAVAAQLMFNSLRKWSGIRETTQGRIRIRLSGNTSVARVIHRQNDSWRLSFDETEPDCPVPRGVSDSAEEPEVISVDGRRVVRD